MKFLVNAASRLYKEVTQTYSLVMGKHKPAIEAEKAAQKLHYELMHKFSYNSCLPIESRTDISFPSQIPLIDHITMALNKAINNGLENGKLVVAGVTGITKQIADQYTTAINTACGDSLECSDKAFAYIPYILALTTIAIVVATVANTDVAKKTTKALVENLGAEQEPAVEASKGYFTTISTDLNQKLQSLKDRLAVIPVKAIEEKEEVIVTPVEAPSAIEAVKPAVEDVSTPAAPAAVEVAATNPTYKSNLYCKG